MDKTQLQQQIALYYSKLPPDVQAVFSSMKWMASLEEISKKYSLNEEQKETLATETTLVLLGIIDLEEYNNVLQKEISISTESIVKMTTEIDTLILNTIRPQLADTFQKNAANLAEEKYGSSTQKLDERFEKLPKEVQEAISESNYQATLYKIADKYKLSINQMGALEEVTTKVMLSLIHPDKYEVELGANISIPKDKITELVNDVNEGVLKNIRNILKSHWAQSNNVVSNTDDEVPKPPYAESMVEEKPKVQTPITVSINEKAIYEKAGIEMVGDKSPEKIPVKENMQPLQSGGMDLLADKLVGLTVSQSTVSDHTIPKVESKPAQTPPPANLPVKQHDPYHEVIE
jgi:hypothetical protein